MTLIQRGWSFDELIDFTAVRLASLHTVVNPWLYPLTRRKYRDAFWYLLTLFAYYVTCTLVARPGTTLGEYQNHSQALPCIRLARGKFELTNQDSAGGKKSSVLTSSKQGRKGFETRHLFSLEIALNIHEKEFTFSKTIPVCKK